MRGKQTQAIKRDSFNHKQTIHTELSFSTSLSYSPSIPQKKSTDASRGNLQSWNIEAALLAVRLLTTVSTLGTTLVTLGSVTGLATLLVSTLEACETHSQGGE
jgi:hypothetical protein